MKLLFILILLPFTYLVSNTPALVKTTEDYNFKLTVNSTTANPAEFDLTITGFSLTENGSQKPFKLEKKNLKTPYKLDLTEGKYTAVIESKTKAGNILSKVQGIKGGNKMGSASGDAKKSTLNFGTGGTYSFSGE